MENTHSVTGTGIFIWDQGALSMDCRQVLSSQLAGQRRITLEDTASEVIKLNPNLLTLYFQMPDDNYMLKFSLAQHCVTTDDLGRNGTWCYHRSELARGD